MMDKLCWIQRGHALYERALQVAESIQLPNTPEVALMKAECLIGVRSPNERSRHWRRGWSTTTVAYAPG